MNRAVAARWLGDVMRSLDAYFALAAALVLLHVVDEAAYHDEPFHADDVAIVLLILLVLFAGLGARRREAERAVSDLEHTRDRYRLIVETAEEGIWVVDREGATTFANAKLATMLGYRPEQLVGRPLLDFLDEESRHVVSFELTQRAVRDLTFVRADGSLLHALVATSPIHYDGDLDGALAMVTDIGDRHAAEHQRATLASIIESSSDAIVGSDLAGDIVSWNHAAEQMYGYSAAEAIGMHVTKLAPPERAAEIADQRARLAKGERIDAHETVRRHKNGSLFDVSLTLSPIRDRAGRSIGTAAIVRDISGQKRLEEHLRSAQRMEAVGHLAGGVAHDFNNSLMAIRGYSELMLRRLEDGDPLRRDAESIQKAAEGATALTRQLLAFSRKQVLQPRLVNLSAVVATAVEMLRSLAGEHIELHTTLAPELAPVKADPTQLEQVLVNLVLNARDAMPDGGTLTIETADVRVDEPTRGGLVTPGSYVVLKVTDTGSGMAPDVQQRAFEPFFTTKEAGKGTGMGLSSVYGIVKQSDGSIWIDSESGGGTTFTIYLPRADEPALGPGRAPVSYKAPGGTETLLLAEDDDDVRAVVRQMLELKGYRVLEATDGEDALRVAGEWEGDLPLVVSDVVMPRVSGPEFASRLRQVRPETKVLFVSGYADEAIVDHGVLDGLMFMQKPFSTETLARRVRAILDSSALGPGNGRVLTFGGPQPMDD